MKLTKKSKGISPLIAAVLLIAFTMAIASIFAQWAPQIMSQSQDESSQQREDIQACSSVQIDVIEADAENITVQQTSGSRAVGNLTVTWTYTNDYSPLQSDVRLTDSRGVNSTNNTYEGFNSGGYRGSANLEEIEVSPRGCPGASPTTYEP